MRRAGMRSVLGGAAGCILVTAALASAPAAVPAGAAEAHESWFLLELDGRAAGWSVERWWREADGRVVTESETVLRVVRGTTPLAIELSGRFEETADGEPLFLSTRQALGKTPVETAFRFTSAGVVAQSIQDGRRWEERLPQPEGDWLTPAEARRAVAAHHAAGDREYAVRTLDPMEGLEPVTVRRTRVGEAALAEAAGRWHEEVSSAPGMVSEVELDATGEVVRSTTVLLGLTATLRRVDRETALAAGAEADGAGPPAATVGPEVLVRTLVRPDRPIPEARKLRRAVYVLSLPEGSLPDLPSDGAQRVERRGERLRVTVTPGADGGAPPPPRRPPDADPVAGGAGDPALTASTLYLNHEDPGVRRLLEAALHPDRLPDADPHPSPPAHGPGLRDRDLALVLTSFVHGYVHDKGLDTGFATASEVARSRRGDCTEHAVLLAALLRAVDLPSRVVTGLVYLDELAGAEGVFGYHMWVQALVDGRWLDLDPTLPWGFDAAHIALGVSDLASPGAGGGAMERVLPLVGKLRIRVVELRR